MGADPEVELLNQYGGVVDADNYVSDPYNDEPFGLDGCPKVAELRPRPGNWNSVYFSLRKIIKQADKEGIRLTIEGDTYAIGGHIHFAIHRKAKQIASAMDSYVYPLFDKLQGSARGGYNCKGAIEYKRYGFEYRSLPAGWLATPLLCKLTLKLSYKIAVSVVRYNLTATGEPVAPEYSNYRHFINKRDFATLLAEIDRVAKNRYCPINENWVSASETTDKYSYSYRDDYYGVFVDTPEFKLPVPVVFFGLKKERGENILYCPRLPELAGIVGAVNYITDDLTYYDKPFPLYVGLSPDLRKPDVVVKILDYVCNHYK
ncbi:MAG: hypothetical protein GYA16_15625 [Spirochaetes bacterium]|nr:hypothetical protein [Spirochaetota bacterium]